MKKIRKPYERPELMIIDFTTGKVTSMTSRAKEKKNVIQKQTRGKYGNF